MNNICNIQLDTLDNYFEYLEANGYLRDSEVSKIVVATLLVDTLEYFKEFITKDFVDNINKILKNIDCCSCFVTFDNVITCEEVAKTEV